MGTMTPRGPKGPRHARAVRPALRVVSARAAGRVHPAIARSGILRHWAAAQVALADALAAVGSLRALTVPSARQTPGPGLSRTDVAYVRDAARNLAAYATRCADELDQAVDLYDRSDPDHPGLAAGLQDDGPDGPPGAG